MGDKTRYSSAAMDEASQNFAATARRLEAVIATRRRQVATAMATYEATGVSDEYAAKERAWTDSADRVVEVIATLRSGMERADSHAADATDRVRSIGQDLKGGMR